MQNVTLIDGTGAPARGGMTVILDGDQISRVAATVDAPVPEGAEVLDGRGRWLLPGLIDMHVHLALVGDEALLFWLGMGVTTVRQLGGDMERLLPLRAA